MRGDVHPPETLLKAKELQALFTVRSDRQLCARMQTDLVFRWFDLPLDQPVLDASTLSQNLKWLFRHEVADHLPAHRLRRANQAVSRDLFPRQPFWGYRDCFDKAGARALLDTVIVQGRIAGFILVSADMDTRLGAPGTSIHRQHGGEVLLSLGGMGKCTPDADLRPSAPVPKPTPF